MEGEVQTEMKKVEEEHEVLEPLNRMVDEQQVGVKSVGEAGRFKKSDRGQATGGSRGLCGDRF